MRSRQRAEGASPLSSLPPRAPDPSLAVLGAQLAMLRVVPLDDLVRISELSLPEVRDRLRTLSDLLAPGGLGVTHDGIEARLVPAAPPPDAVEHAAPPARTPPARGRPGSGPGESPGAAGRVVRTMDPVSSPVLIGRDRELDLLLDLASTTPSVTVIVGEAGVGKSRLVTELTAHPASGRLRFLVGHCHPLRERLPLGPVIDSLGSLRELPSLRLFSPVVGVLGVLLPELADRLPPPPPPLGDSVAERHRVFRALVEMVGHIGPTVWVFEDVHWVDEASLEFLRFLAAQPPSSLALILTYRDHDTSGRPSIPALVSRTTPGVAGARIDLRPLSIDDVRQLVAAILDVTDVSEDFATYLHERTAGIPFAVEEVVRLLRDRRDVVHQSGSWLRRTLDALEVPPTLRDFVLERASRLRPEARGITDAAAVIGESAESALLSRVAGLPPARGDAAIRQALAAEVLIEDQGERYGFRHPLARQAVYEALPHHARKRLHLRTAAELERLEPPPIVQLAHHYRLAGRTGPWLRYAEAAAALATERQDHVTAARLLSEATACDGVPTATSARLALKLAWAALTGHAYQPEAAAALRRLVDDRSLPAHVRGHLRGFLGLLLSELGDASAGYREQARAIPELRRRPELAALAMGNLALPGVVDGHESEHRRWLERAMTAAADLPGSPVQLVIETVAVLLPVLCGDRDGWQAARDFDRMPATMADSRQLLWLSSQLIGGFFYLGHYARARAFLADADRRAHDIGWGRFLPIRDTAVLMLDWAAGEWKGLEARALRQARTADAGYPAGAVLGHLVSGLLRLALGDLDSAETHLRLCSDGAVRSGIVPALAAAAGGLARVQLERGEPEAAVSEAERGLAVVGHKGIWPWAAEVAPLAVEAMLAAERSSEAEEATERLASGLRDRDSPLASAALEHCRGLVEAGRGRHLEAAHNLARAARAYAMLPRPYEAARCDVKANLELHTAGDKSAGDRLVTALVHLEELAAVLDADRLRAELRRMGIALPRGRRPGYGNRLSPREAKVAELAATGLTYKQIAATLSLSPRTVEHQLGAAIRKLGVPSRAALARRWLAEATTPLG